MTGRFLFRAAATVAAATALWFVVVAQTQVPPGWGGVGHNHGYRIDVDPDQGRGGTACVRLEGIDPVEGKWAGVGQKVTAAPWRGRRLRLSAWIRSEGMEEWGGLYFRVDDRSNEMLAFGNNRKDPVRGTTDWRRYEVVLDVPEAAEKVAFGVHLNGRGVLWADDFSLDVVERR